MGNKKRGKTTTQKKKAKSRTQAQAALKRAQNSQKSPGGGDQLSEADVVDIFLGLYDADEDLIKDIVADNRCSGVSFDLDKISETMSAIFAQRSEETGPAEGSARPAGGQDEPVGDSESDSDEEMRLALAMSLQESNSHIRRGDAGSSSSSTGPSACPSGDTEPGATVSAESSCVAEVTDTPRAEEGWEAVRPRRKEKGQATWGASETPLEWRADPAVKPANRRPLSAPGGPQWRSWWTKWDSPASLFSPQHDEPAQHPAFSETESERQLEDLMDQLLPSASSGEAAAAEKAGLQLGVDVRSDKGKGKAPLYKPPCHAAPPVATGSAGTSSGSGARPASPPEPPGTARPGKGKKKKKGKAAAADPAAMEFLRSMLSETTFQDDLIQARSRSSPPPAAELPTRHEELQQACRCPSMDVVALYGDMNAALGVLLQMAGIAGDDDGEEAAIGLDAALDDAGPEGCERNAGSSDEDFPFHEFPAECQPQRSLSPEAETLQPPTSPPGDAANQGGASWWKPWRWGSSADGDSRAGGPSESYRDGDAQEQAKLQVLRDHMPGADLEQLQGMLAMQLKCRSGGWGPVAEAEGCGT
ncbi:hypothetical protein CYMTET_38595 [Cymbomonas tetramitiformis]|uniref:Uncharacterized protein n=1 Tax=Cymbomonas tetramitiformis TaxID=36881 RepID=A0AAE0F4S9_9CHLO|nr:hypothetical protein CYMTET_38595 [Cymbomonas tetramitiformis]